MCIGFLSAWSPYAIVSMWAAFGQVDNIPPLAFALPAMFAKSSTIYNPIICLMLRPNFRKVMRRDLKTLYQACLKSCVCLQPEIWVRLRTNPRQTPSQDSAAPPVVVIKDHSCEKCNDAFECFRHYGQVCIVNNPLPKADSVEDQESPVPHANMEVQSQRTFPLVIMCAKRTSEIDNLHINLEMVPGHAKVAWPWHHCYFCSYNKHGHL